MSVWGQLPYNTEMAQGHYNDGSVRVGSSGTIAWSSGVKLGNSTGGGFNWDDKYIIIALSTDGVPKEVSFTYYNSSGAATGSEWYVAESADNSSFSEAASWSETNKNSTSKTVALKKSTKYIKLCYSGNFAGTFANIKVTELQLIGTPSHAILDFGSGNKGITSEKTINIEWVNVPAMTYSLSGTDESHISVSISNNSTKGLYGTAAIVVQYKHPTAGETLNAILNIKNAYNSYSQNIALVGSTEKQYFVSFDGNGSTSGAMGSQTFDYNSAQGLAANAYIKEVSISYNLSGGNCNKQSEQINLPFVGWADRGSIVYNGTTYSSTDFDAPYYANAYSDLYNAFGYDKNALINHYLNYGESEGRKCVGNEIGLYPDKANVRNLSNTNGYTVPLYANWGEETIVLPTPTRDNYVFTGWYDGGNKVGIGGDSYKVSESKTLTAHWQPLFNFSVTANKINSEYGTVKASVADTQILGTENQKDISTSATFTATPAEGCTFQGWYLDETHTTLISSNATYITTLINEEVGSTKSLTLYAWFKKNQTLTWNTSLTEPYGLVVGSSIGSAATSSISSLPITYQSSNNNVASISSEGLVTGVATSPDAVTITASQSGNDQYNAAESITRTFYVLEKLLATFSPNGFEGTSPTITIGGKPTITLANIDEDFTFSSSDPSVVSITRNGNEMTLSLTALKAGSATITLNQPGNATHNASSVMYNITVVKHQGNLAISIPNEMKVGETCTNFYTTGNDEVAVNVNSSNTNVVSYANGVLTAVGEGTATITISQTENDEWVGESKTQTITVSKNENTLNASIDQTETEVDSTIPIIVSNQNNTITPLSAIITETTLSSSVNNGTDVIVFEDGIIKAKNAGTAKIKIIQEANAAYTAFESQEYTITVHKLSNYISVTLDNEERSSKNVARGTTVALGYSSLSDAPYSIARTSGSDAIATISGNSIISGQTDGTNIWTISQAETYKYEAAEATIRIKVNSIAEEEGYVVYDLTEYSHGTGEGSTHTYELSGPGEIVTYSAKRQTAAIYYHLYVQYSTDGSNWINVQDNTNVETDYNDYSCEIPEDAKYIRFYFPSGGTLKKYVKNVKVTRKTYVRASSNKTDLGTIYTDQTATATISVDYSTTNGGNIEILSNNPQFTVDPASIIVSKNSDNVGNTAKVTVTYTPDPDKGSEEATITVGDLFYSNEIKLTASCKKHPTTISKNYEDAAATMKVGNTIENAFSFSGTSSEAPSSSQDADFYYVISNPSVVNYNPATNRVSAVGEGTVTISIYQKKTKLYYATSQQYTFTVSRNENPLTMSVDKTNLKVEDTATVLYMNKISDGAITATYTNEGIVSYNSETGIISALGAGTTMITLTQAATTTYQSKSQSFEITVSKHDQTIKWDNEVETSLLIGTTLTTNTATASSGLNVTYTSSNPNAISVDANTGELKALDGGTNITLTATQSGNYKYNSASITRTFMVWDKVNATLTTTLVEGETNELPIGNTVTIGSNAPLGDENISITGNEDHVVSWVLTDNVLTITPIKEGTITIQLNRAEDDSYFALSKLYTIQVIKPVLTLDPVQAPTINYNEYSSVVLKRTLPAGYCTICLPFSTTPEFFGDGAWAAQLSLVTYNEQDGFTLFFTKCSTIEANKPYILYLTAQVTNPTWKNVDNLILSTPQSISDKGWTMTGNYTPNFSMEGKYGVVSTTSNIRKGSGGSYLNAFTAYLTYNGSANVKVAASYLEDEGELSRIESIDSDSMDDKAIYDLQGRKVEKLRKGIYIVDGKKILK